MKSKYFICKGCKCELDNIYYVRTKGYCYLCDPNITVEEVLNMNKELLPSKITSIKYKIKKVLLTIIYPFWVFFSKTIIGNILIFYILLSPLMIITWIINPSFLSTANESSEAFGQGLGIATIFTMPFTFMFLLGISNILEDNYECYTYKTNFKNNNYKDEQ